MVFLERIEMPQYEPIILNTPKKSKRKGRRGDIK